MDLDTAAALIRDVPDFPKPGIVFKDIAPLLQDGPAWKFVIEALADRISELSPGILVGVESRGFLFAAPIAYRLGCGVALVRKPRKLPYRTLRKEYALEYGTDTIEMHVDAVRPGQGVVVIDDVLATGGTAAATGSLVREAGGEVLAYAFMIELALLEGRGRLREAPVFSLFAC